MGARASKCTEFLGRKPQRGTVGDAKFAETSEIGCKIGQQQQEGSAGVRETLGNRSMRTPFPFVSQEDLTFAEKFEAQRGDVMIVTYPKCGTTWCQQLCHQLRTGGHIDFEEISEERIVPWLEVSHSLGIDITLPQIGTPRCFKTHQMLGQLSQFEKHGTKFLCVLRDPEATLLSEFKFLLSKGAPVTESKDVNIFATLKFLPKAEHGATFGGSLWEFYVEFWRCRMMPNVCLLAFEDLKRDLEKQVVAIADFMGLPALDPAVRDKVLELGSFAWMQKNDHLFDDHHMGARLAKAKGKGKGKGQEPDHLGVKAPKVGLQVGDDVNAKVTEETRALLAKAWREIVEPVTGHATYQDLIEELRQIRL